MLDRKFHGAMQQGINFLFALKQEKTPPQSCWKYLSSVRRPQPWVILSEETSSSTPQANTQNTWIWNQGLEGGSVCVLGRWGRGTALYHSILECNTHICCTPELPFTGHFLWAQHYSKYCPPRAYLILPTTLHILIIPVCMIRKLKFGEMEEQGQNH